MRHRAPGTGRRPAVTGIWLPPPGAMTMTHQEMQWRGCAGIALAVVMN